MDPHQPPLPPPGFLGVVHLLPLPGAPRFRGSMAAVLDGAARDAAALAEGGVHGVIVENFGDMPLRAERVDPETVAAMALAVARVRAEVGDDLPVGVNVLRNDARAALGLCAATGASFLRVNVHTGAAVTDQGLLTGHADETLRERARLAPTAAVLADVHVKHATPLGGAGSIAQAARDTAQRGLADGLIVSGSGTGWSTDPEDLLQVREALPEARLWVGSGFTPDAAELLELADGAIVGTWLKRDGRVSAPVDPERVRRVAELFAARGRAPATARTSPR